jgi:hypothetical protein
MARKVDYSNLGPNARLFVDITMGELDRIIGIYIKKVRKTTGMDINIKADITYSVKQLENLDDTFDYSWWGKEVYGQ